MKHKLKISVADESSKDEVVTCKKKTMKKGLFKKLFGFNPDKVTIIDSLQEIDGQLIEWSDSIWISMIDKAIVDKDFMEFQFKNGKKEKVMYKKSDI